MKKICKPFTYLIKMVQVLVDKKRESSLGYSFSKISSSHKSMFLRKKENKKKIKIIILTNSKRNKVGMLILFVRVYVCLVAVTMSKRNQLDDPQQNNYKKRAIVLCEHGVRKARCKPCGGAFILI